MSRNEMLNMEWGTSYDSYGAIKVVRNTGDPNLFDLLEAKPQMLRQARRQGKSFDWPFGSVIETTGLTADQLGSIILDKISGITRR